MKSRKKRLRPSLSLLSVAMTLSTGMAHAAGSSEPMPESGTLLVMGSFLLGIAIYNRLRNKE